MFAEILTIKRQGTDIFFWALCDPKEKKELRRFVCYETGKVLDLYPGVYIGTVISRDEEIVYHVYEVTKQEKGKVMSRIKWRVCKEEHDWVSLGKIGIYQCSRCRAKGYTTIRVQPLTGKELQSEVKPYRCPSCGGPTINEKRKCPNCLAIERNEGGISRKEDSLSSETSLKLNANQKELLFSFYKNGDRENLEKKEGNPATFLKRKGLVERVIIWRITKKGINVARAIED